MKEIILLINVRYARHPAMLSSRVSLYTCHKYLVVGGSGFGWFPVAFLTELRFILLIKHCRGRFICISRAPLLIKYLK